MLLSPLITLCYALMLILGGVIGYLKVGSLMSLTMGSVFGCVLIVCSWALSYKLNWGRVVAFVVLGALTVFFGYRFTVSGQLWPAGMMSLAAILTGAVLYADTCRCSSIQTKITTASTEHGGI